MKEIGGRCLYMRHFLGVLLLMVAFSLVSSGLSLLILPVTEYYGFSRSAFGLCSSLIMAAGIVVTPFLGSVVVRVGIRGMIFFGMVWGTAGFFLLSVCSSIPQFCMVSFAAGLAFTPSTSYVGALLINAWFIRYRALILSLVMAGTGLGGTIWGILLPGWIEWHGHAAGYRLIGLLWLLLLLAAGVLIRDMPDRLGAVPYGDADKDAAKEEREEGRGQGPASRRELVQRPDFWMLCGAILGIALINGYYQHMQAHLVDCGYDAVTAGHLVSAFSASLLIIKVLLGVWFERIGFRRGLTLPVLLDVLSLGLLLIERRELMSAAVLLFAANSAMSSLVPQLSAGQVYTRREYVKIWGFISAVGTLGNSAGIPLWGLIYDFTWSYQVGFAISLAVLTGSFMLLRSVLKEKQKME